MRDHRYYVYILTNWNNQVMYVGMTNDLMRRVYEHRTHAVKGFTEKYNVFKLVYFEEAVGVHSAIAREKEIKKWRREKKNALVVRTNPEWRDVGDDLGLARHFERSEESLSRTMREILSLVTMISPKFPRKTQDMGRNDTTPEVLLSIAGSGFRWESGLGKACLPPEAGRCLRSLAAS